MSDITVKRFKYTKSSVQCYRQYIYFRTPWQNLSPDVVKRVCFVQERVNKLYIIYKVNVKTIVNKLICLDINGSGQLCTLYQTYTNAYKNDMLSK